MRLSERDESRSSEEQNVTDFRDFNGEPIRIGDEIKIQGATDSNLPIYLLLEYGKVKGFGRSRVIVELDQYPDREVRVLPRALRHATRESATRESEEAKARLKTLETPLFLLVTYQTVLPLDTSDESLDELTKHVESFGHNFTVVVERMRGIDIL